MTGIHRIHIYRSLCDISALNSETADLGLCLIRDHSSAHQSVEGGCKLPGINILSPWIKLALNSLLNCLPLGWQPVKWWICCGRKQETKRIINQTCHFTWIATSQNQRMPTAASDLWRLYSPTTLLTTAATRASFSGWSVQSQHKAKPF